MPRRPYRRMKAGDPPTAAQLERRLRELEDFAATTWSNLAMVDKVADFRAELRAFLHHHQLDGSVQASEPPPKPILVHPKTRWG